MIASPKDTLFGLTHLASQMGAQAITIGNDSVTIIDALGRNNPVTMHKNKAFLSPAACIETLHHECRHFSRSRTLHPTFDIDGQIWVGKTLTDTSVVLSPQRRIKPTLEHIASFSEEDLEKFRRLYLDPQIAIMLSVEGESRLRQTVLAVIIERRLLGLGIEKGKDPVNILGPDLSGFGQPRLAPLIVTSESRMPSPGELSAYQTRKYGYDQRRLEKAVENHPEAIVHITVELERSEPIGSIAFSPPALERLPKSMPFLERPWETLRPKTDRKRSAVERTWHPTIDHVSAAYLARQAPRGYVSSNSLFFHGPIAYSQYDSWPIMAFVEDAQGNEVLLKQGNISGNAVVTTSTASITRSKEAPEVFHVGDLTAMVSWGDADLERLPWRFRKNKNEFDFPRNAKLDIAQLKKWLEDEVERTAKEIEAAMQNPRPTKRQIHAHSDAVHRQDVIDTFAERFGFPAFAAFDRDYHKAEIERISADYEQLEAERAGNRKLKSMFKP